MEIHGHHMEQEEERKKERKKEDCVISIFCLTCRNETVRYLLAVFILLCIGPPAQCSSIGVAKWSFWLDLCVHFCTITKNSPNLAHTMTLRHPGVSMILVQKMRDGDHVAS